MIRVELEHATVAFTGRHGGVSAAPFHTLNLGLFTGDEEAAVRENIERVRAELGVERIALLHQVHGGEIAAADGLAADDIPDADGAFARSSGVALLATGADCPPVALASETCVAIVHCGWRPLAAGIVERALGLFGGDRVEAAIGPGISAANYEVGPEVVEALGPDGAAAFDGGRLDLSAAIRAKLARAGVSRIEHVDRCTYDEAREFFSHRRDGAPTGRQAGIVWRS